MYVGVDEAGKGPVLGPMIAAAVGAPAGAIPEDIADSKRLSPERREQLDQTLRDHPDVAIGLATVAPAMIDSPETDMNGLTVLAQARAVAEILRRIENDAVDVERVVVDAGDVSEARFGRRVRDAVAERGHRIEVVAEHGADDEHSIVAAASVVAKVERDRRMAEIGAEYADRVPGDDFEGVGSGYPSDPTTRTFLRTFVEEHGELPDCARRSWSTCDDVLAAAQQSSLGEF